MKVPPFPVGGYGELICPWCTATLMEFGDRPPEEVAEAHYREAGHSGRPVQVNQALRIARMSRTDVKD